MNDSLLYRYFMAVIFVARRRSPFDDSRAEAHSLLRSHQWVIN